MSDNFLNDPLFQNLSPMKKAVITELLEKSNNTSLDKAFPLLLKANATLTKNGEAFTSEERNTYLFALSFGQSYRKVNIPVQRLGDT